MAGRVVGGFNQYGFTVGILMLDTRFPRIVGDMGNAATFDFPVRYHRVSGADPDLVVRRGASGLLPSFVEGARALEREGVSAITTNCGFLVKFQRELCAAVTVPVFTSSLLLVPLVHRMLPPRRRVGILTVNAGTLTPEHLEGAAISPDIPIAVAGLETEKEFTRVLLGDELELDVEAARAEHVKVARRRNSRPVPDGDGDPFLAGGDCRLRALRRGVRRGSRLPEDRLSLPRRRYRRPSRIRRAHGAPAPARRRREADLT